MALYASHGNSAIGGISQLLAALLGTEVAQPCNHRDEQARFDQRQAQGGSVAADVELEVGLRAQFRKGHGGPLVWVSLD